MVLQMSSPTQEKHPSSTTVCPLHSISCTRFGGLASHVSVEYWFFLLLLFYYDDLRLSFVFFFSNLKQSFALEKHGGKKCYMIGARGLSIIWGDAHYWTWKPLPDESRFVLSLSLSLFTDVFTR